MLLVVYVISQLTSSYFMSTSMQKAQRVLLLVLPIVFIPFILNFPSGLMIYWLTTNLWTTGQGLVTRKLMPKPDLKALQERRSSRTPPKDDGAAQQSAKAKPKAATSDGATTPADGARPKVAGPPRRVKKKRSGGGRRR